MSAMWSVSTAKNALATSRPLSVVQNMWSLRSSRPMSASVVASSSTSTNPRRNPTKRLPRSTLRSLVELHHASADFVTDPAQINPATFRAGFNELCPTFVPYNGFRSHALSRSSSRTLSATDAGHGLLLGELSPASNGSGVMRNGMRRDEETNMALSLRLGMPRQAGSVWKEKTEKELWSDQAMAGKRNNLSEREWAVREALLGVIEDGANRRAQPSLEGVEEWLEAKGAQVQEVEGSGIASSKEGGDATEDAQ